MKNEQDSEQPAIPPLPPATGSADGPDSGAGGSGSEERPPEEPATLAEWLWYVKRYEHGIFVRVQSPCGRWENAPLDELTPKQWGEKVAGMLDRGILSCRVKEPEELIEPNEHRDPTPRKTAD